MRVLVVGGGGREHALCWKLTQSPKLTRLYAAPGNPGMAQLAECFPIPVMDIDGLVALAQRERIDLTVVGPEDPMAAGIADRFEAEGLRVFGPSQRAAEIESSKAFALGLMHKYDIPTADYAAFTDPEQAEAYLKRKRPPFVVKADGLAAGKGVVICPTIEEAREAVHEMMVQRHFGDSGGTVVIMDYLEGEEASILAVTDGEDIAVLAPAQDHKRIFDGDRGPNTGGMGAYAPAPVVTDAVLSDVRERVLLRTLRAMKAEGRPYKGVLYAGIILTADGPKVIEFNCRFGDPETQVVLPLLEADLLDLFLAACEGRVKEVSLPSPRRASACVVVASEGYPGDHRKGRPISGLEEVERIPGTVVFHAGTAQKEGRIVTSGGRVLGVTAIADDLRSAITRAYEAAGQIRFDGVYYRKDIGHRALKRT
ncbi:MAG: phosphoribosylamine--glycine ligase [Candidatus Latescibacteria bacterium]|nr:phosphoribosylamine--glycine ligase [Candidatus Latescibacterota bacterium]